MSWRNIVGPYTEVCAPKQAATVQCIHWGEQKAHTLQRHFQRPLHPPLSVIGPQIGQGLLFAPNLVRPKLSLAYIWLKAAVLVQINGRYT